MKRSGSADLPLHYGHVPKWLAERMGKLGLAITEAVLADYGKAGMLKRLSDPFWFQSFGAVMGMDWHSSGITTSVMGSLKRSLNPLAKELGLYICGGKGKLSRQTPSELFALGERTGLDADYLVRCSKLSAKVDNTAVQDGFQLYMHNFIVSSEGSWTVVQQGMKAGTSTARRYHWHSENLQSFTDEPHSGVTGTNQGMILNMVASEAAPARTGIMSLTAEAPNNILTEAQKMTLPAHHDVRAENVDLKRLGSALWLAHEKQPKDFEELLLLEGVGPRTIQSLALVSEVIHGTASRFKDPARFSFAHGGKDGHPFPVPLKVYDETIRTLRTAVDKAKIGVDEKKEAIRQLHVIAERAEKDFHPNNNFNELVEKERDDSWKYDGHTVFGKAVKKSNVQLRMF